MYIMKTLNEFLIKKHQNNNHIKKIDSYDDLVKGDYYAIDREFTDVDTNKKINRTVFGIFDSWDSDYLISKCVVVTRTYKDTNKPKYIKQSFGEGWGVYSLFETSSKSDKNLNPVRSVTKEEYDVIHEIYNKLNSKYDFDNLTEDNASVGDNRIIALVDDKYNITYP